jgi:hypothetical protein
MSSPCHGGRVSSSASCQVSSAETAAKNTSSERKPSRCSAASAAIGSGAVNVSSTGLFISACLSLRSSGHRPDAPTASRRASWTHVPSRRSAGSVWLRLARSGLTVRLPLLGLSAGHDGQFEKKEAPGQPIAKFEGRAPGRRDNTQSRRPWLEPTLRPLKNWAFSFSRYFATLPIPAEIHRRAALHHQP